MSPPRDRQKYARERHAAKPRERLSGHLQKAYGLSLAEYDALVSRQGGLCAVCEHPPRSGHRLHVDHDHQTGVVRALLCGGCNSALGLMDENPDLLFKLFDYAEHCVECRAWYIADPIRRAVTRAYQQSANLPKQRQLLLEALQRLRNAPVKEVMSGRRGRAVAKILEDRAAPIASLPAVAPVRAGAAHDAVYV